jgi:hypothetical protein
MTNGVERVPKFLLSRSANNMPLENKSRLQTMTDAKTSGACESFFID